MYLIFLRLHSNTSVSALGSFTIKFVRSLMFDLLYKSFETCPACMITHYIYVHLILCSWIIYELMLKMHIVVHRFLHCRAFVYFKKNQKLEMNIIGFVKKTGKLNKTCPGKQRNKHPKPVGEASARIRTSICGCV